MELKGEQEAIRDWVKQHWLECISDQEQDRKDGFGLVVIGTWDGEPQEMEVSE
jgi:CRISPR-associated protein Cmr3